MIYYEPVALHAALKRVKEVHPISLAMLETGEGLQGKEVWNALVEKLERTPLTQLEELEKTLRQRERKVLHHLINHKAADIRYKVALFTQMSPEYMKSEFLWEYVIAHMERAESEVLARAVALHQTYRNSLGSYRWRILRELANGGLGAVANEFWRIAKALNSHEKAREEIRLQESSRLGHLVKAKLLSSMRATWLLVDSNYFERALIQTSFSDFQDVLVSEYLIWRQRSEEERLADPYFARIVSLLDAETHRQRALEQRNGAAWKWYLELLIYRRMEEVFAADEDNERFRFWWAYRGSMVELPELDRVNERIFMDFGEFGVVEFARTGNAAYFYDKAEFERVKDYQRVTGGSVGNAAFKRSTNPLDRKIHRKGWQTSFENDLRQYFRQSLE